MKYCLVKNTKHDRILKSGQILRSFLGDKLTTKDGDIEDKFKTI